MIWQPFWDGWRGNEDGTFRDNPNINYLGWDWWTTLLSLSWDGLYWLAVDSINIIHTLLFFWVVLGLEGATRARGKVRIRCTTSNLAK